MKDIRLNTLHRYVGIAIAPFLVIQTVSGLLLGFGLFRGGNTAQGVRSFLGSGGVGDEALVKTHFGPGPISDAYHLLLAAGIIWMAVSGWLLYLRLRRARRKPAAGGGTERRDDGERLPAQ